MLTEWQIKYLEKISDDKKILVKPRNPAGLKIADKIIKRIRDTEPNPEIILLGSLPLRILGQEDIDITAFCIKSEQEKHNPVFAGLY